MSQESHLFLGDMGYESLSTIIVLVIVVIALAVWLPKRTANGMERVNEHREDRYSPSLHLVDADSGTRFSDAHTPQAKGAIMQSARSHGATPSPERIAEVRRLRRAAIRRRRIIVVSLLAVTVVVLALSFPLRFSPLFALIPAVLLAVVLALGVRASRHARAWEHRVAEARRASNAAARARRDRAASAERRPDPSDHAVTASTEGTSQVVATTGVVTSEVRDDRSAPTDVMEQREIRRALRDAEREQAEALARRRERRRGHDAAMAAQAGAADAAETPVRPADPSSVAAGPSPNASEPSDAVADAAPRTPAEPSLVVTDMTAELDAVHPTRAIDAFDMATSQDLISFSLGAPRNGFDAAPEEPQSLEIRSTKQVAKAVPVAEPEPAAEPASDEGGAERPAEQEAPSSDAPRQPEYQDEAVNDAAAFHEHEVEAPVDAPAASDDSLGTGLEAILARRGA